MELEDLLLEDDDQWNSKYSFFKVFVSQSEMACHYNFKYDFVLPQKANVFAADGDAFCFSPFTTRRGDSESVVVIVDEPNDTMAAQPLLTVQLV